MFVFFGVVVCYNATRRQAPRWYRISCLAIAVLMAAVALGVFPVLRWMLDVRWSVFFLEATQTALFAAFWFLQTIAFVDRNPVTAKKIAGPAGA
jgi:high-affinity Fe2+/Pb2+ permease